MHLTDTNKLTKGVISKSNLSINIFSPEQSLIYSLQSLAAQNLENPGVPQRRVTHGDLSLSIKPTCMSTGENEESDYNANSAEFSRAKLFLKMLEGMHFPS